MPTQTVNVNPSFNIQQPDIETSDAQLFIEAGPTGVSFVILTADNCFSAVVIYSFPQGTGTASITAHLKQIFDQEKFFSRPFKKINIIWTFPESILVPHELVNTDSNESLLTLIYGDVNSGVNKTDFLFRNNIHNVYRIPSTVIAVLPQALQYVNQTHQYSLLPELVNKSGNRLFVIFYNNSLTLLLSKDGNLQVIQHYTYQNADDAAYHLLNVCENFDSAIADTILQLSGMIDTASNLYTTLYKYFLHIELFGLPENASYTEAIKNYPAHYFSYLFALAICV